MAASMGDAEPDWDPDGNDGAIEVADLGGPVQYKGLNFPPSETRRGGLQDGRALR